MTVPFTKMQGCGNDYVYINGFDQQVDSPEILAPLLSDRHRGVGGDGLVLIQPSAVADARMRMFNADGSEGRMCGNAIRCVGKYLYDNGIVPRLSVRIETHSGIKALELSVTGGQVVSATVDMGHPVLSPENIPVNLPGDRVVDHPVYVGGAWYQITCVSMGNPHAIIFCDKVDDLDIPSIGPLFENNRLFPEKVNTEFVQVTGENRLKMRVWERGSGETLACGTGACASVVAAVLNGHCNLGMEIVVSLPGGELMICYTGKTVYMTGKCEKVFDGTVDL
jgi:diaminopimelate epimerase